MEIKQPTIEVVPIEKLKPWDQNPKQGHAVEQLTKSIERFGYLSPIVVQKDTYRILAGHGRHQALIKAGVKEVQVVIAELSDREADLFTVADNRLAEYSNWDGEKLAGQLLLWQDQNVEDLSVTGLTQLEIGRLLDGAGPGPELNAGGAEEEGLPGATLAPSGTGYVKLVQLYVATKEYPAFKERLDEVGKIMGIDNTTEIVLAAVRTVHEQLAGGV